MADFTGVTITEFPPKIKDEAKLRKYLSDWRLGNGNYGGITAEIEDGQLFIYGYEWFDAYPDNEEVDYETERFAEGLRRYISSGSEMVIIMIGHEKCRYAFATRLTITPEKVEWFQL